MTDSANEHRGAGDRQMNNNEDLSPEDVIKMSLAEFEQRFGFRPVDALEKKHFAVTGNRPNQFIRDALEAGVMGDLSTEGVVME